MKRIIIFLSVILINRNYLKAQVWDWAFGAGTGTDIGSAIATDNSGNFYAVSNVSNGSIYGAYTVQGAFDNILLAKHNTSGGIVWARTIIGAQAFGISLDKTGNSYITGSCSSATFNSVFGNIIIAQQGNYDAFIAKFDTAGNVLWVKLWGFPNSGDGGAAIKTDFDGNSYVAGRCTIPPYLGGPLFNYFLLKYDAQGNLLWSKTANWQGDMAPNSLDIDLQGNCYVTGVFSGVAYFDNIIINANTPNTIFIVKYDANGNLLWAKKDGTNYDAANGIKVNNIGHFFLTGQHSGPSVFGNISLSPSGVFVAKYDASGNILWARHANAGLGKSISTDASGNCFVTGWTLGTMVSFPANPITITLPCPKERDIFVAKYDSTGNCLWAMVPLGTPDNMNQVMALATDNAGNCYITGQYCGTTVFGSTSLTAPNGIFIAKLKDTILAIPTKIKTQVIGTNAFTVYPNPTANVLNIYYSGSDEIKNIEIKVTNVTGQCVYSKIFTLNSKELNEQVDLSKFAKGVYFIEMLADTRHAGLGGQGKKEVKMVVVD